MARAMLLGFGSGHQEERGETGKLSTPTLRLGLESQGEMEGNKKWGQRKEAKAGLLAGGGPGRRRSHFSFPF